MLMYFALLPILAVSVSNRAEDALTGIISEVLHGEKVFYQAYTTFKY